MAKNNKKYDVKKSKIQGDGAFAKQNLNPGDYIGKVHTILQPYVNYEFTELGRKHNHSDNPNVQNILIGNERHLVATEPIKKGQELKSNYRLQPDLEQPEDFEKDDTPVKAQDGENILPNYRFPIQENQRPFINPYGYSFSPEQNPNVKIYGIGAEAQYDVNDRLNLRGGINSQSVLYPGGSDMFMKPTYNVGLTYKFEKGGWLDKYNDGGPVQENYNDYSISTPPGFVGMGYDTQGRNYSPAWGGQFEDGGYIPQAQDGFVTLNKNAETLDKLAKRKSFEKNITNQPQIKQGKKEISKTNNSDGRSFWETASQFIPVYEQFLDIKDIVQGAFTGDTEMRNRGIVGMAAPVSGKAVIGGLDYLTEKTQGKEAADYNEDKRKSIINSPTFNRALFEKYGWGGYDKWVKAGKPPLYAQGGSLPGSVGFTYARTHSPAPSEGPYAKKTLPSAQNGQEMSYYQHGLDWKPRNISRDGSVVKDDMGYWNPDNWGKVVEIDSPDITMQGVNQPLLGISDEGDVQYMEPGKDYKFKGKKVKEYPIAQKGYVQPTSADSARLYNAQIALNKFYDNEKRAGRIKEHPRSGYWEDDTFKNLQKQNLDFYRKIIQDRIKYEDSGVYDDVYKKYFNLSPEQVKKLEYQGIGMTKSGNQYQQYYRDLITPQQNLASPFAMIDSRITPDYTLSYEPVSRPNSGTYPGGSVMVYAYEPLRIKPYHMRTPQEKIEWEKKYGDKTQKPKPKQQTQKSSTTTSKQTTQKPKTGGWKPLTTSVAKGHYSGDIKGMVYRETGDPTHPYDITFGDTPKPKPTSKPKPEPTLKKRVLNVEPIKSDVSIASPKVTELRRIDETPSSTKGTYNWNVEYFDPTQKKTATKTFATDKEAEQFYNNPANRASRKYSDKSSVGRMQQGGWLDKYN